MSPRKFHLGPSNPNHFGMLRNPWSAAEEVEDHRRLGLRPYWSYLKGSFFAYEPAPADGGVGICWEKEVQTWTLPTLLGIYGHQFSLKQLWYAWENLPIEKAQPWATWWWSTRSSRTSCGEEEDPEGDNGFP